MLSVHVKIHAFSKWTRQKVNKCCECLRLKVSNNITEQLNSKVPSRATKGGKHCNYLLHDCIVQGELVWRYYHSTKPIRQWCPSLARRFFNPCSWHLCISCRVCILNILHSITKGPQVYFIINVQYTCTLQETEEVVVHVCHTMPQITPQSLNALVVGASPSESTSPVRPPHPVDEETDCSVLYTVVCSDSWGQSKFGHSDGVHHSGAAVVVWGTEEDIKMAVEICLHE